MPRSRVAAAAGMGLLFAGLLMALSLVVVGLALLAVTVGALLVAGTISLTRRVDLEHAVRLAVASTAEVFRATRERLPRVRLRERSHRLGARALASAARTPRPSKTGARHAFERSLNGAYRVGLLKVDSLDASRRAQALNELGARLRRRGDPEQAAEQHRAALEIVRDLGDQRAEAMTLNNLGLALSHTGAGEAAVEYLEQAVDVLHELGDEEYEGQVIANLGLVYRRQGQGEEAATLFQEALEKLSPASPAYRQIEEELRRAS